MKTKLAGIVIICLSLMFAVPASGTMGLEGEMNKCISDCHKADIVICEGLKGPDRAACNVKVKDECAAKCACDACGCDTMKLFDLKQMVADYADLTSFSTGVYVNTASLGEAAAMMAVDIFRNEKGLVQLNAVKRVVSVDPVTGDYIFNDDTFTWIVSSNPNLSAIVWNEKADDVYFADQYGKPVEDLNLAGLIDLLEFIGYPKVILGDDGFPDFYQTLMYAAATLSDGDFLLLSTRIMAILSNSMTLGFAGYQNNVIMEVDSITGQILPVDSFAKAAKIVQFLVGSLLLDPDQNEPQCKFQECIDPNGVCEVKCEQCMDAGGKWDWQNFQCIPASVPCEYSVCFDRNKIKVACDDLNAYCEEFYPEGCDPNAKLEAMAAVIILPECPW
jgi:hypothetical protein